MRIAEIAMWGASACYAVATVAYFYNGKPWTAATTLTFCTGAVTLWMAGRA